MLSCAGSSRGAAEWIRAVCWAATHAASDSVRLTNSYCCRRLTTTRPGGRMDVILDNAGLELYTDLVMADFLVASGLADKVGAGSCRAPQLCFCAPELLRLGARRRSTHTRFCNVGNAYLHTYTNIHYQVQLHGKLLPWFVSDTMDKDLEQVLAILEADAPPAGMQVRTTCKAARASKMSMWPFICLGLNAAQLLSHCRCRRCVLDPPLAAPRTPPPRCRSSSGAPSSGSRGGGAATWRRGGGCTGTTLSGRRPSPSGGWSRWDGKTRRQSSANARVIERRLAHVWSRTARLRLSCFHSIPAQQDCIAKQRACWHSSCAD